jgi:4-hydroxy-2-oxoheptanedioate aldolase
MSLRERMLGGELIVSTMISEFMNPNVGTMLATAGLDSMIIDMEHSSFGWPEMSAMVSVARASGLSPVVRIPEIRRETVLKPLDAGASGLLVPMVNTARQAEDAVRFARYPPAGARGAALRRPHSLYRALPAAEYLARANEEVALILQIETPEALENVEEIASVDGVDALFVGPFDLSVNMGIPGKVWDPRIREAFSKVIAATKGAGIAAGIQTFDLDQAQELVAEGVRYLSFSGDVNLIIDPLARTAESLREPQ